MSTEAHDESFIEICPQRVLQKTDGSFLFEIETAVHRPAGVHQ